MDANRIIILRLKNRSSLVEKDKEHRCSTLSGGGLQKWEGGELIVITPGLKRSLALIISKSYDLPKLHMKLNWNNIFLDS